MDDKEIVAGLIARNNSITQRLFFVTARPMLQSVIRRVFETVPDYGEIVNELYAYLVANDCAKLRMFRFESSFMSWLKVVAVRYFLRFHKNIVEERSISEVMTFPDIPSCDKEENADRCIDIDNLLESMDNIRYANVIRRLILEESPPAVVASEMGITVDNLYNIKRRALSSLARIAIKYSV